MADLVLRGTYEQTNLDQRWRTVIDHASALGIRAAKVGVSQFYYPQINRTLRGAIALEPIAAGEEFIVVPEKYVLSDLTVGNSSLAPVLESPLCKSNSFAACRDGTQLLLAMAVFITREGARSTSLWMPFIKTSIDGHDIEGLPLTWPTNSTRFASESDHFKQLTNSRVERLKSYLALELPRILHSFPAALSEGLPCLKDTTGNCSSAYLTTLYDVNKLIAMFAVVSARYWFLELYGEARPFLAPIADLMNFGQMGVRVRFSDARKQLIFYTLKPIPANTEILFHYGDICREKSMLAYGFAPAGSTPCRRSLQLSKTRVRKPLK
uniref:SET domain-containing protein n=1 Tax=Chrysotila carterae TaxID=13221 RepID=A0A7S4C3A1_CHRCT